MAVHENDILRARELGKGSSRANASHKPTLLFFALASCHSFPRSAYEASLSPHFGGRQQAIRIFLFCETAR